MRLPLTLAARTQKPFLQVNRIKLTNFEMTYNLEKEIVLLAIRKIYSQSNEDNCNKKRCVLGINEVSIHPQLGILTQHLVDGSNMLKLFLVRNFIRLKGRS